MNFAEAEPKATSKPIVTGSASTIKAEFEAIRRFDGPAKGMRFKTNEVSRIPRSSYKATN